MAVYHRWTKEMIRWLLVNYKTIGDKELAEKMNVLFRHKYRWTLKHVEKKRSYLKLRRTKKQVYKLRQAMNKKIDHSKMWDTRGRTPVGKIVIWLVGGYKVEFIRLKDGFERLARHTWQTNKGVIPVGYNVIKKDLNKSASDIDNLICLSNQDLAALNSMRRYPEEIRETSFLIYKLNNAISEKQNIRFKQPSVRAA
jgi:hypothetical protein